MGTGEQVTATPKKTGHSKSEETLFIAWKSFEKPSRLTKGDIQNAFFYGPDRARHKKTVTRDGVLESVTVYNGETSWRNNNQ
jgi:hypothetical protein